MTLKLETRELFGVEFQWPLGETGAWNGPAAEFKPLAEMCVKYLDGRRMLVVCAGACMGMFPRLWLNYFDSVVALEPDPSNFAVFELNCPDARVRKIKAALGEEDGEGTLYRHHESNMGMHSMTRESSDPVTVRVCTVDSLGLEALDLLQLDVEGSEIRALLGADVSIRRFCPVITAETVTPDTRALLDQHGYREVAHSGSDTIFKSGLMSAR